MDARALETWPMHHRSRLVRSRPHHWHMQETGEGPDLLLIHGTGASTHSWHGLMAALSSQFRVIAVDLPGHGFTQLGARMRSSLSCIAEDLLALVQEAAFDPSVIVGHSAGAAIALKMSQACAGSTKVAGINPALQPFLGVAGLMFPMAARMMAMTPGLPEVLSRSMAQPGRVRSLLAGTGSAIPEDSLQLYERLFADRAHVEGTLLMMSQWKLDGLIADLPRVTTASLFLTGDRDRMVPPVTAVEAADRMPEAEVQSLDGFGHLMHEEAPEVVARHIIGWVDRQSPCKPEGQPT